MWNLNASFIINICILGPQKTSVNEEESNSKRHAQNSTDFDDTLWAKELSNNRGL